MIRIGPGSLHEDNGVIPRAKPILKATLGELTTEEIDNSVLRVKRAEAAQTMLNAELATEGLKVEAVLVR